MSALWFLFGTVAGMALMCIILLTGLWLVIRSAPDMPTLPGATDEP